MTCQSVMSCCVIVLPIAACLGMVCCLLLDTVVEVIDVVDDIRARRRREAVDSSSSAGRCRACVRGVCGALRSADEDSLADRGDAA